MILDILGIAWEAIKIVLVFLLAVASVGGVVLLGWFSWATLRDKQEARIREERKRNRTKTFWDDPKVHAIHIIREDRPLRGYTADEVMIPRDAVLDEADGLIRDTEWGI